VGITGYHRPLTFTNFALRVSRSLICSAAVIEPTAGSSLAAVFALRLLRANHMVHPSGSAVIDVG